MANFDDAIQRIRSLAKARFDNEHAAVQSLIEELKSNNSSLEQRVSEILSQKDQLDQSLTRSLARIEKALTRTNVADLDEAQVVDVEELKTSWAGRRYFPADSKRRN